MKWNRVVILLLQPDDIGQLRTANAWKRRYRLRPSHCFTHYPTYGYRPTIENCMANLVDAGTKLIIFCKGDLPGAIPHTASALIKIIKFLGVRQLGLLALKGSCFGCDSYLDAVKGRAEMEGLGIGWLIGYKHQMVSMRIHAEPHLASLDGDILRRLETYGSAKRPDEHRVRVLQGNIAVTPPAGFSARYQ